MHAPTQALKPTIGPRQYGVGPSGNHHLAAELLRAAAQRRPTTTSTSVSTLPTPSDPSSTADSFADPLVPLVQLADHEPPALDQRTPRMGITVLQPSSAPRLSLCPMVVRHHPTQRSHHKRHRHRRRGSPSAPGLLPFPSPLSPPPSRRQTPPETKAPQHHLHPTCLGRVDHQAFQVPTLEACETTQQEAPNISFELSLGLPALGCSVHDVFTVALGESTGASGHQKRADQAATLATPLPGSQTQASTNPLASLFSSRCSAALTAPWTSTFASAHAQLATSTNTLSIAFQHALT